MTLVPQTHPAEVVAGSLDQHRDRIFAILDGAAIDIGAELLAAKREHPRQFLEWVRTSLPFGEDKAERLMAITRVFGTSEPELLASLPKPWTALYELSRLPVAELQAGVEEGEIHPAMTVDDARQMVTGSREAPKTEVRTAKPGPREGRAARASRLPIDFLVGELVRYPLDDLDEDLTQLLRRWLGDAP